MRKANRQNPKILTLRFRAYQHCMVYGTDLTVADLAEALNVTTAQLRRVLRGQKWSLVLRSSALDVPERPEFKGSAGFEDQQDARAYLGVTE
ncbi:hypothetical protein RGQ15_13720 [Paracoccus sp. MBLB3053]|uniref:Uncharacterized protein n=1 Tax=Paracoccus aurantius TaxID=3073814 RepID=A0ABU2HU96_9RHOB|nr:hypothetical protein [Paracoccus sp. MBLB3053]MDS9468623.1 hypothetical protein [Paracoccus sp. MBLB3053]